MYAKAFAKINIYLDVLDRKEDGYHNLDMVMLPLELHDVIEIEYLPYLRDTYIVCDKVEDCFPAKFRKSDDTFLESSTLKDSTALGRSKYGTKTVGVQFMNGVRAIIAYNPFYTLQSNGDIVKFTKDTENKTVKMTTDVISMLFDVSEDDNNKLGEDILQLNMSLGGADSELVQVGPYKIKIISNIFIIFIIN